jgi:hypothetical protein
VSFFPTILAGPITRVSSLIDQFEKRTPLDAKDGGRALFLIGLGLVKKLMIADYLAGNLVNRVFDFPNLYTGAENLIAVYSYTLQLYYDFSGYTDIAIGSALLLGIKLPPNFNRPYAAHNIAISASLAHYYPTGCALTGKISPPDCGLAENLHLHQSVDHHDWAAVARTKLNFGFGRAFRGPGWWWSVADSHRKSPP